MAHWLLTPTLLVLGLAVRNGLAGSAAAPPRCASPRCSAGGFSDLMHEYTYTVDGMGLLVEYIDGDLFALRCSENLTLDNPAMPRFESQLFVYKALLKDCGAPRGSYGAVLRRLNLYVSHKIKVSGAGRLAGAQLADLGYLHTLELMDVELEPRTLAAPARLRSLTLEQVCLPPSELRHLPRSLESLDLTRMGTDIPRVVLDRLPALVNLTVRDAGDVNVALGGALRVLALEMPAVRVPSVLTPELRSLTVFGWAERSPVPWTGCALDTLYVRYVLAEELPARWVSDCVHLRALSVQYGPQLRALHATSLRGARRLEELHLTRLALTAVPEGLLDDAKQLRVLDLSGNFLKELPSGLLMRTHVLETLNLSKNQLTADVCTSLNAMTSLRTLNLRRNDQLDSCHTV